MKNCEVQESAFIFLLYAMLNRMLISAEPPGTHPSANPAGH